MVNTAPLKKSNKSYIKWHNLPLRLGEQFMCTKVLIFFTIDIPL